MAVTETAITDFTARARKNLNEGCFLCCVFLGLSKAFDTFNHKMLLKKLQFNGIKGNMFSLLNNYLSNGYQFIQCDETQSHINKIVCCTPQGSTLGPLLFSLYIKDLPIPAKFHVNVFADDRVVLILKNKNVDQLQKILVEQLSGINEWIKFNTLSTNHLTTTYFIISPKNKKSCLNKLRVKTAKHIIPKKSAKYLEITFDYKLKWSLPIDDVIKKLNNAARILCKIRHIVSKQTIVNLCYSVAYAHLKYGI